MTAIESSPQVFLTPQAHEFIHPYAKDIALDPNAIDTLSDEARTFAGESYGLQMSAINTGFVFRYGGAGLPWRQGWDRSIHDDKGDRLTPLVPATELALPDPHQYTRREPLAYRSLLSVAGVPVDHQATGPDGVLRSYLKKQPMRAPIYR